MKKVWKKPVLTMLDIEMTENGTSWNSCDCYSCGIYGHDSSCPHHPGYS